MTKRLYQEEAGFTHKRPKLTRYETLKMLNDVRPQFMARIQHLYRHMRREQISAQGRGVFPLEPFTDSPIPTPRVHTVSLSLPPSSIPLETTQSQSERDELKTEQALRAKEFFWMTTGRQHMYILKLKMFSSFTFREITISPSHEEANTALLTTLFNCSSDEQRDGVTIEHTKYIEVALITQVQQEELEKMQSTCMWFIITCLVLALVLAGAEYLPISQSINFFGYFNIFMDQSSSSNFTFFSFNYDAETCEVKMYSSLRNTC
ncbi:hypothetical protein PROFUN_03375 [Planoprotostelium fungivorum]|uniref:Uncharacterized protein n=1 Tax=Planoprotostelium fungivorum TaxID=1890364 RepID=A0A2P6NWG2_9EUKA|nr:hypothetical protein PROFUN_03375 [Planoprotostelium fungivorum]